MPDPVVDPGLTSTPQGQTTQPAPAAETPELPDFDTALAAIEQHLVKGAPDYEERLAKLRSHRVVAGVAGSIADSMRKAQDASAAIEAAAASAKAERERLREMARNEPEAFADQFLSQEEADEVRQKLESLRETEEKRIAGHIGLAVRDLPELQELSLSEQRKIADALAGVPSDQVLGVYTKTVIDIAADKRAEAVKERDYPARLEAELAAAQTAASASRLRSAPAPSLVTGANSPPTDIPDPIRDPAGYVRWIDAGGRRR